jgi:hypothetical protein
MGGSKMYRQYENPYELNKYLCELEAEYQIAIKNDEDIETLIDLQIDIETLKDRINFAWQDDEYDYDHRDLADEMWMWENVWGA